MSKAWQELQDSIGEWASKQFPHQTHQSKIEHLRSELKELEADPTDIEEFADCFMLLIDTARISGFSMVTVLMALWAKLEINKEREWQEPDENGVSYHVKSGR